MRNKTNFQLIIVLLFAACNNTHDAPPATSNFQLSTFNSIEPTGNAQLDSLLQLAAVAPQDTNLARLYYEIGYKYEDYDFEKAKEYYQKMGTLSEQLDWNEGRYYSATGFSTMLTREGLPDSAVVTLQNALEYAISDNNESWIATLKHSLGAAFFTKNWYETALRYCMEVLPFMERENDANKLQLVYHTMSQLYGRLNSVEKAIDYGEKALALDPEDPYSLLILGLTYANAHQEKEAVRYLEEALRIFTLQNNIYGLSSIYYYLCTSALYSYDLEKAERYAHQSMEFAEQMGDTVNYGGLWLLSVLEQLKGNYSKSEEYAKKVLQMAIEQDISGIKKSCYMILYAIAVAQRKHSESVHYLREIDFMEQEIAQETTLHASEEMAAKYETEKKELEIARQQDVIAKQNMQRWLLIGGITVCVVFLALLWYMLRLRNRRNLALTERNDALSEMNATKDKFFSIISHDLRNPVVAQRDALQLLVQNSRLWDVDALTAYYGELLKSAEGQVELIYNLLGWAQLQTGRFTYNPSTFNLAHRLRSDISLIRNMADKKDITLAVNIPDAADITGDGAMLSIVVRNLLTNAIKFTAPTGTVTLSVERNIIKGVEDFDDLNDPKLSANYTVTISDTGIGMNAEQIGKLFRIDSAHSRKGTAGEQGSGLGLIVCRELVEKHGSELHVESEEGKGSRFWFELSSSNS